MNQNSIPAPLRKTLWKLGLIYGAMSVLGLAYGIFGQDLILCSLSLILGVVGTVKFCRLQSRIRHRDFCVYQGIVLSDKHVPFQNRHVITLLDPEYNEEYAFTVTGRDILSAGGHYTIYLDDRVKFSDYAGWIPELLDPPDVMLGYEKA